MFRPPQSSTLFPYTTLFRSGCQRGRDVRAAHGRSSDLSRGCRRSRSEEHTSELQSHSDLVCRLLLEKKKTALTSSNSPYYPPACRSSAVWSRVSFAGRTVVG